MTAEKKKAKPPRKDVVEEQSMHERMDRLEALMENLMNVITSDDYAAHYEKKKKKRVRVQIMGTATQAQRARVARAARKSGIPLDEWVEKYGTRDVQLSEREKAPGFDPRQLQIPEPPKKMGRPRKYPEGTTPAEKKRLRRAELKAQRIAEGKAGPYDGDRSYFAVGGPSKKKKTKG